MVGKFARIIERKQGDFWCSGIFPFLDTAKKNLTFGFVFNCETGDEYYPEHGWCCPWEEHLEKFKNLMTKKGGSNGHNATTYSNSGAGPTT